MGTIGALPFSKAVRKLVTGMRRIPRERRWTYSPVVITILCYVSHPRQRLVATLLDDLEVPHLYPRHRKVGNLEFDRYRGFLLYVLFWEGFTCQEATVTGHRRDVPLLTLGSPKCARIRYSRPPPNCFIFQTNADLSGAYCTLPVEACPKEI
jgi:hypothetical protein